MSRTRPWELTDALWERLEPLIPARPLRHKGGRPARSDREMMGAMLYVLRTGLQWNALPREYGASTTVYDVAAARRLSAQVGSGLGGI